jgi:hypothetical protein
MRFAPMKKQKPGARQRDRVWMKKTGKNGNFLLRRLQMLRAACCVLRAACCVLRAACCVM